MNTTTTNAARTYSPAVYLAALKHSAGTAAARGAEARRETARNAAAVRMTIAAVLQAAEDVTARRAPSPDPETIRADLTPAPAQTAARPAWDLAEMVRRASDIYRDYLTQDPAARSRQTWYESLRAAADDMRADMMTARAGTVRGFFDLTPEDQYKTLRRAASRVPAWAARAARRLDPETASGTLPPARWTFYESGTRTPDRPEDDRELVHESMSETAWMTPRRFGGDPTEEWADALDMVSAETWTRMRSRLDSGKASPDDPAWIEIYRQTLYAARTIGRRSHDRPARQKTRTASLDGETARIGDAAEVIVAANLMGARPADPEAETITAETIRAAASDDLDMVIVRGKLWGWTQTQIADRAGEVIARDSARRDGRDLTPEDLTAAAAQTVNHGTISRRLRAMRDRLDIPEAVPYWAAHNPGPAPIASPVRPDLTRTVRQTPDGWTAPEAPETPAPSRPAVPVPSVMSAPASLPLPAWRTAAPVPAPAQTGTPAPETPADPDRETIRAADRRASASLARLAARREAMARRAAADREARAAAPARYAPASPEDIARREHLARAAQTVREAMARRAARTR